MKAILEEPWKPVSRPALMAWLVFYVGFLLYAFSAHGGFLFIDMANLVVHEGGHNLFGWFGPALGLWGGTLLQWLVPFLLAAYFFSQRQTAGFVFCLFFFFENWLYTATYMADARAQVLPLVTTGDPDFVEHDWFAIFTSLSVLNYDTTIATVVRLLGWCGMIASACWLGVGARGQSKPSVDPLRDFIRSRKLPGNNQKTSPNSPISFTRQTSDAPHGSLPTQDNGLERNDNLHPEWPGRDVRQIRQFLSKDRPQ